MKDELIRLTFDDLINERLQNINFSLRETEAYVKSTFIKYIKPDTNLPNKGITLLYAKAKSEYSFNHFQELADWLLFLKSTQPKSLNAASPEYYNTIAQLSYYKCYNILHKKWKLFEEMADRFPYFVKQITLF